MKVKKQLQPSERVGIETGPGLTEQAHAKECDINQILKGYYKTGLIKHAQRFEGKYDDFSSVDFQNAMYIVAQARQMFGQLPAKMRQRFNHDPGEFMDFCRDSNNREEMQRLGILKGNDGLDIKGAASKAPVEVPDGKPAEPKDES